MADSKRMKGTDNKLLSEEHTELIREAESLGVDTYGYKVKGAKLDQLRDKIAQARGAKDDEPEGKPLEVIDVQAKWPEKSGRTMKPSAWARLLEMAEEHGVDTEGAEPWTSHVEVINARIEEAVAKAAQNDTVDDNADAQEVTETIETTAVELEDGDSVEVLVRVVEWGEWIPGHPDKAAPTIVLNSGVTSFTTRRTEKLLDVQTRGTGMKFEWDEDVECPDCDGKGEVPDPEGEEKDETKKCELCEGTGKAEAHTEYGLYLFSALLAENVSDPRVAKALRSTQFGPMRQEIARRAEEGRQQGRNRAEDLVIVEHGAPKPNRDQRRGGKKRRNR